MGAIGRRAVLALALGAATWALTDAAAAGAGSFRWIDAYTGVIVGPFHLRHDRRRGGG